jgi:hypothetical protein
MSDTIRVFVNGAGVDVPRGAIALDAVRAADAAAADAVEAGAQILTDSRGLPTDAAQTLHAGAIFRLVPKRDRARPDDAEEL